MKNIDIINARKEQYTNLIKQIKHNRDNIHFQSKGRLTFCLIEFRIMPEIGYVINSILKVYHPNECGLTLVFGRFNKEYMYEVTKHMKNINYVCYDEFDNLNIRTYNKFLKWNVFYKHFENFEFVSIIQTDALLIRKIDEIYFTFDYIGAPWKNYGRSHGGNGGFSLRNINIMLETTKNNIQLKHISGGKPNEDLFFSNQRNYNYCKNEELHRAFSVETFFHKSPVGIHKIFFIHLTDNEFLNMLAYIERTLIIN